MTRPKRSTKAESSFTSQKLDLMDAIMADPSIRPAAKPVAFVIIQFARPDNDWKVWPSMTAIGVNAAVSEKTARKHVAHLVETGWLENTGHKARGKTNIYRILTKKVNAILDAKAIRLDVERARMAEKQARSRAAESARSELTLVNRNHKDVSTPWVRDEACMSRAHGSDVSRPRGSDYHHEGAPESTAFEGKANSYFKAKNGE